MPNVNGVNNVKSSFDTLNFKSNKTQFYEQRQQLVYQFKTDNYFPKYKLKVEANASFTKGKSSAPDFKNLEYKGNGIGIIDIDPTNDPADRYFRYLKDDLFDSRIAFEFPLSNKPGVARKIKFGGSYQHDQQKNDQYNYHVNYGNGIAAPSNDINQILSVENFGLSNNTLDWYYSKDETPINHTFGYSSLVGGYAMADYAITTVLRVSGGLRVEHANIFTDVFLYDSLGYKKDDIRRNYKAGTPSANPGTLDKVTFLPSANIIYKLRNLEDAPLNVRFNFSQTCARPSIRELSDVSVYDYELQANVTGNSNLKIVNINNYDVRVENYFKSGDNFSVSLFYKDFKNHIELEYSDSYYWQNVDKSSVKGIELEGKLNILKQLEFRSNITFVKSTTTFIRTRNETIGGVTNVINEDTIERPMFGQAPNVLN
jgi:outer membrane receptor protein involved in Fe transport